MNCPECGQERDPNLRYCGNCGLHQISISDALNLYWILWFVILVSVYLGEMAVHPLEGGAGMMGLVNYLLITGVDAIIVVAIFMYGGLIADRIGKAVIS